MNKIPTNMQTDSNSENLDIQSTCSSTQSRRFGPISPITTPANITNNQYMTSLKKFEPCELKQSNS